ncbi:MAG TPA: bifunctional oligoribonuclease/PAP phosphatase NrnA [Ktedonobacterales bacterium]|nr:bifunctional oligoribonuclease/PAP phosphatase NrnA [Ktedonobacterales bacterium]
MTNDHNATMRQSELLSQQALASLLGATIDHKLASAAWRLIEDARSIALLAHEHPDPDALGSALGLAYALEPLGKVCTVACADPSPASFTFLPGRERIVTELPHLDFDLVIALDAGEFSRYGRLYEQYNMFFDNATTLNIDHHISSSGCGKVNIIDPVAAATAELLTVFLAHQGVPIGRESAICLLAGVITDTRSFEFEATTSRTLAAGAYLVACGAVPQDIVKPMYRMKPLAKARLWGETLRTLGTAMDGRVVWASLTQEQLRAAGATSDMDDGLPSYLMDIEGVALAALFKEQENGATKVSLRSAHPYNAAAICQRFGGGGHVRAAGCTLNMPVEQAIARFTPALEAAVRA